MGILCSYTNWLKNKNISKVGTKSSCTLCVFRKFLPQF